MMKKRAFFALVAAWAAVSIETAQDAVKRKDAHASVRLLLEKAGQ
jgi:hypothetical protein